MGLWHFSPLSESHLWRCLRGTGREVPPGTALTLGLERAEKTQLSAAGQHPLGPSLPVSAEHRAELEAA